MGNEEKAIGGTIDGNSVSHQTQTNFREFFSSNEIGSPKAEPLGVYTHAEMKTHSPEDQAVHFTIQKLQPSENAKNKSVRQPSLKSH